MRLRISPAETPSSQNIVFELAASLDIELLGDVRQFEAIDQSGCGGIDALETLAWFESSPASHLLNCLRSTTYSASQS